MHTAATYVSVQTHADAHTQASDCWFEFYNGEKRSKEARNSNSEFSSVGSVSERVSVGVLEDNYINISAW